MSRAIRKAICRAKAVFPAEVVDYLQKIPAPKDGRYFSEFERVSRVSSDLQQLGRTTGKTVIALSQLSRAEKRKDGSIPPPTMSSLRQSGQIEQDADVVLLLYKEYQDFDRTRRCLDVAKNKDGEAGGQDVPQGSAPLPTEEAAGVALVVRVNEQDPLPVEIGQDCRQVVGGDGLAGPALQIHHANDFHDISPFLLLRPLKRDTAHLRFPGTWWSGPGPPAWAAACAALPRWRNTACPRRSSAAAPASPNFDPKRLWRLRDFLMAVQKDDVYDYVVIDMPPAFSLAARAALVAADEVIVPIKLDAFSVKGMAELFRYSGSRCPPSASETGFPR